MVAYFTDEKIEEVNEAVDLVELISNYVSLKRAGNIYKGLCPFHSEKTPSFVVTPHRRMFHCFGCGVGGGPIRFLMMIAGHSFPEAVEELARRYGVELPRPAAGSAPRQQTSGENRAAIYEVLKTARDVYEKNLWSDNGAIARRYLADRGLESSVAREFRLGLSPGGWDGLTRYLKAKGFGEKVMLEAGLIKEGRQDGHYDTFRDRLMIPIIDAENRTVGFGGRLMTADDNQPKYLNSPETAVYKKSRLLYGYNRARPYLRAAGMVFMVEGYFDLIAMVAGGINEVTATLGTALTPGHLNLLKGHVREVMLLFDSDEAGQRAAARALPLLLNAELDGRVLRLPPGHDPDTFMREFGTEALYEAASQAMDIVDFQVARMKKSYPDTMAGQARMAREAKEIIAQVPDSAKSQLLRRRLARMLELDEAALGGFAKKQGGPGRVLSHQPERRKKGPAFDEIAGALLKFMLIHPETIGEVTAEMAAYWPDDESRQLFSRLKDRHEAGLPVGPENIVCDESDELAALVSEAALSERSSTGEESMIMARAYMDRLIAVWRKKRQAALSEAIARAEAAGDGENLRKLLTEKNALQLK
ncbi:DNA primase [Deltaproteobacteria bacterium Smac51]|nr:DNA primase [Deltaproteobacteria bacterium Smac51]